MSMLSKHHSSERLTRGTKVQRRFRPRLEVLEDRTLLAVNLLHHYTGLDFAQSSDSVIPPDTNGAAGPTSYIEVVNDTIAIYTPKTTGAAAVTDSLSDFWFTQGGLLHADASSRISDVVIVWDEQIQRFIVGQQDVDFGGTSGMHVSRFDIAVSKTASPATLTSMDWKFYPIITTETGFDADYPGNFGWNHDEFVFTLNMFSTTTTHAHVLVTSIKSSDLATAAAVPHIFKKDFFDSQVTDLISLRPTVMHDSVAGDP